MRDRLIELIKDIAPDLVAKCGDECDKCTHGDCVGKLADYLLKNGVIVPLYKINAKVYVITSQTGDDRNLYIFEDRITHYRICDGCTIMCLDNHLGVPSWKWNNVFLTREEAEKVLERSEE